MKILLFTRFMMTDFFYDHLDWFLGWVYSFLIRWLLWLKLILKECSLIKKKCILPQFFVSKWYIIISVKKHGLPWWLSGKEPTCQCRRLGFNPRVRKIPWIRKWQLTLISLPGKSHGQNPAGYIPWGHKSWTWISN